MFTAVVGKGGVGMKRGDLLALVGYGLMFLPVVLWAALHH
jgi:hypothetical protein